MLKMAFIIIIVTSNNPIVNQSPSALINSCRQLYNHRLQLYLNETSRLMIVSREAKKKEAVCNE